MSDLIAEGEALLAEIKRLGLLKAAAAIPTYGYGPSTPFDDLGPIEQAFFRLTELAAHYPRLLAALRESEAEREKLAADLWHVDAQMARRDALHGLDRNQALTVMFCCLNQLDPRGEVAAQYRRAALAGGQDE